MKMKIGPTIGAILFSLLLLCAPVAGHGAAPTKEAGVSKESQTTDRIPALLEAFLKKTGAAGVAVAILKKGADTPRTYAAGVLKQGENAPFTSRTRIKIGSTTKVFTAYRIKMLIEEGKLTRETPLSTFFPDHRRGKEITIEHLLTHSSGLPEMLMVEPFHSHMDTPYPPAEIWAMIAPLDLDFVPGAKVKYSNTNFLVLGLIIERLTGHAYNDELQAKILTPLGMTQALPATQNLTLDDLATGYAGPNPPPYKASLMPPQATGGIIACAEDLVKLVNGYRILKEDPLNANVRSVLLTNGCLGIIPVDRPELQCEQGYAEGFEVVYYFLPSVRMIGKLGSFPGYASGFYYWPDTQTAVSVTTNQEKASLEIMLLARTILTGPGH